jgi:arylsulfatase A-like enzyme
MHMSALRLAVLICTTLLGCKPRRDSPSLVIISIDTMRADRLGGLDPEGRSITPALDAFAAQSLQYRSAWAISNETLFSHAALFLGQRPSAIGPLNYRSWRLPPDAPTLAAHLARAGWRTEAVVASGHLAPIFGIGAGFQRYQSTQRPFSSFQETMPEALERLQALAEGDRPFFLFVHGYDCHSPYIKPGPLHHPFSSKYHGALFPQVANPLFWERLHEDSFYPDFHPPPLQAAGATFLDPAMFSALERHAADPNSRRLTLTIEDRQFMQGVYDAAVAYADFHVGRLLEEIDRLRLYEDTVVVVLSDHGEGLLDHGLMNHRASLHDENLQVPLLIRAPGLEPGVEEGMVGLDQLSLALRAVLGVAEGPGLRELGRPQIYAQSLLGEHSLRRPELRLRAPGTALAGPWPAEPGPGMELLDAKGKAVPWSDPRGAELWSALQHEMTQ